MMAVSLLTEGRTEIRNVPRISDVFLMAEIIRDLGCRVIFEDDVLMIDASGLSGTVIPNTGITLPFISYGGTSVLFLMVEMGMVLSVSNRIRLEQA